MRRTLAGLLVAVTACGTGGDTTAVPVTESSTSTALAAPPTTVKPTPDLLAPPTPPPAPPYRASIDAVSADQLHASWRPGCPVGPESLRLLRVSHWGFDGTARTGSIVVHQDHAEAVVGVFRVLYDIRYPIERMEPVDVYGGSDDASMDANNTSAFNCRAVTGGSSWSQHSYGWAIDLNPIQNPYVTGDGTVLPPAGRAYTDRADVRPGMVVARDSVVGAFESIGWGWGGYWSNPDYQHFSATGS